MKEMLLGGGSVIGGCEAESRARERTQASKSISEG